MLALTVAAPARGDNPVELRGITLEREQQVPALPDDVDGTVVEETIYHMAGAATDALTPAPDILRTYLRVNSIATLPLSFDPF